MNTLRLDGTLLLMPATSVKGRGYGSAAMLALMAAAALLFGCSTASKPAQAAYDPATSARIRVYGNNGFGVVFYQGKTCLPDADEGGTRVSGAWGQAFGALAGVDQNESIGMPASQRSSVPRNGVLAREYFKEYVVRANEPIALKMAFLGTPNVSPSGIPLASVAVMRSERVCVPFGGVFKPEAAQDYDVYPFVAGSLCASVVARINEHGADEGVSVRDAPRCQ